VAVAVFSGVLVQAGQTQIRTVANEHRRLRITVVLSKEVMTLEWGATILLHHHSMVALLRGYLLVADNHHHSSKEGRLELFN
jgi:hypothetical protein